MDMISSLVCTIIGLLFFRWWKKITNKRRPDNIPYFLSHNEGFVFFGYIVCLSITIYGLISLAKANLLLAILLVIIYVVLQNFTKRNNTLDSQISWIFKMYYQEKKDRNNKAKTNVEMMQITAKRYLSTMGWSSRYYLFAETPPKDLNDLVFRLIDCVKDVWVDPRNENQCVNFWKLTKEKINFVSSSVQK